MKKILVHIYMIILLTSLTGCYGYRQVGLLQVESCFSFIPV